ncbi:MAG: hypothetical protein JJU22_17900 [Gammaproteobacteria bacterium]|jgi:hypothetical protein|nr:hypothetical protein [Gammaproteobacteria bacterium]
MTNSRFAVCIRNEGYEVSLELRKLYEILDDAGAREYGQIRVIDESGEDYLYPEAYFAFVQLPAATEKAVVEAA